MNVPETFFSVREELLLFGLSCICGMVIGAVYDIFRTVRLIFPHGTLHVFIEDIIFMAGYAAFVPAFASFAARGEIRLCHVIGNVLGYVLYFFTAGSVVNGCMRKLTGYARKGVYTLISPLRSVYVFLRKKVTFKFVGSSKNQVKTIKKRKILLLKSPILLYNEKENKKERT